MPPPARCNRAAYSSKLRPSEPFMRQLWFPDASSSWITSRRPVTTLGDSVWTTILGAAGMAQEATSERAPCTSTRHTRQAPVGVAAFR
jgi:hypothetical protein